MDGPSLCPVSCVRLISQVKVNVSFYAQACVMSAQRDETSLRHTDLQLLLSGALSAFHHLL